MSTSRMELSPSSGGCLHFPGTLVLKQHLGTSRLSWVSQQGSDMGKKLLSVVFGEGFELGTQF